MTSSKDKIELITDKGLPIGVAQIKKADGTYVFGFDPAISGVSEKGGLKKLVKAKQYKDLFKDPLKYAITPSGKAHGKVSAMGSTTGRMSNAVDIFDQMSQWQKRMVQSGISTTTGSSANIQWQPLGLNSSRGFGKNSSTLWWQHYNQKIMNTWSFGRGLKDLGKAMMQTAEVTKEFADALTGIDSAEEAARKEARVAVTDEKVYTFMEANYLPYDYARRLLEKAYADALLNEGEPDGQEK